ncbi:MAG TPA: DNA-deoxyinosine glycosylase [Gammaproteobacteria bacterium]
MVSEARRGTRGVGTLHGEGRRSGAAGGKTRTASSRRAKIADAAPYARGFPPVAAPTAEVLILGSLPGEMSIAMQQYYAQPRNAFWRIMGEVCGAEPALPYAKRLERLKAARIALWDVLAAGERRGSLDSAIVPATMVVNDFASFFAAHPGIRFVSFNGTKAAELYRRHVLPTLPPDVAALESRRLPSTSPANASYSFERKLELWTAALRDRLC